MHVGVDVTCMHTKFGGQGPSGFRDIATLKYGQISLSNHGLYSMVVEKFDCLESAQKIHACMLHQHLHA